MQVCVNCGRSIFGINHNTNETICATCLTRSKEGFNDNFFKCSECNKTDFNKVVVNILDDEITSIWKCDNCAKYLFVKK